uniref:glucuronosyltransferase n=1 Tax=Acrobeloides nanus TaxID=290746 RepID=A0A914BZY6_9BILA
MADLLVQAGHDVTFWIPELISGNRKQIGSKLSKIVRMNDIDDSFEKVVAVYANVSDDNFDMLKNRIDAYNGLLNWCEAILTRKKELEPLKNYGFDMAFTDMIDLCGIGLTKYLGIHSHIWISTGPLHDTFSYNLGIPTPLSYVQVVEDNNARPNMTFWERVNNLYQYLISIYVHRDNTAKLNSLFKKKISPTFPDLHELTMQTALCFVNSEEFIEVARPILHKVIYIGGLGIDKPNPVEEPLKSIMEKAKKGVVLVSLGSITSTATLNYNKKKALYKTFARYKDYVFIIKVSLDDKASERIANNISNIKLFNWVPQPDLLGDPRLKLFITHAGANSLIESAIRGVPVITMPLFFDQFRNAYAAEYKKFAYVLPKEEITEETVDRAIKEVLTNPMYVLGMHKLQKVTILVTGQKYANFETSAFNWEDFFSSDHYLVVGISGCDYNTEISIAADSCPYHMSASKNNSFQKTSTPCGNIHTTLYFPSDAISMESPKLLVVYKYGSNYVYELLGIPYPAKNSNDHRSLYRGVIAFGKHIVLSKSSNLSEELIGIAYDSSSNFLYLIFQSSYSGKVRSEVHLLDPFGNRAEILSDFNVHKNFSHTYWSSDPYTQKFYYYKKSNNFANATLWSIPFGQLIRSLKKGFSGKLEKEFAPEKRSEPMYVHVTNGILYFTSGSFRYLESLKNPSIGIRCSFNGYEKTQARENFMLISGWNYCKLKDGKKAVYSKCESKKHAQKSGNRGSIFWTIVILVILDVIILAGIIVWLTKYEGYKKLGKQARPNACQDELQMPFLLPMVLHDPPSEANV